MDQFMGIITAITPLIATMAGLGLVTKYVPIKVLGYVNNHLIPYGNTLIAFLGAFGGAEDVVSILTGATPAYAGIFGGVGGQVGVFAKLVASGALSVAASAMFEVFLRPLLAKLGAQNNEALVGKA